MTYYRPAEFDENGAYPENTVYNGMVPVVPCEGLAQGIWEYLVTLSPPAMKDWLDIKDVQRGIWAALGAGNGDNDDE